MFWEWVCLSSVCAEKASLQSNSYTSLLGDGYTDSRAPGLSLNGNVHLQIIFLTILSHFINNMHVSTNAYTYIYLVNCCLFSPVADLVVAYEV